LIEFEEFRPAVMPLVVFKIGELTLVGEIGNLTPSGFLLYDKRIPPLVDVDKYVP
jgi:hypothetical protein